jgi:hypothetical protein
MPRRRYWQGPGSWRRGRNWGPGGGGFRGGAYWHGEPADYQQPYGWGWGPCHWVDAGYGPPPWMAEPGPGDEALFLKEEAEALKAELAEIEKRLAELEKEQDSE